MAVLATVITFAELNLWLPPAMSRQPWWPI